MLNAIYYYFYLKPTFRIPSLLRSYGIVPKLHITGIEMDGKNNLFIQDMCLPEMKSELFQKYISLDIKIDKNKEKEVMNVFDKYVDLVSRYNQNMCVSHNDYVNSFQILFKFFYKFIIYEKIDIVFFSNIPHQGWDLLLYKVAKLLDIKVFFLFQLWEPETEIKLIGYTDTAELNEIYRLMTKKMRNCEIQIPKKYEKDLSYMKNVNIISQNDIKFKFGRKDALRLLLPFRKKFMNSRKFINKYINRMEKYKSLKSSLDARDMFVEAPDYSKKFVYFGLHLQPEATTSFYGGEYNDQLLAIERLAEIIPDEWKIYVKENPKQTDACRGDLFYKRLHLINKVVQVPNTTNTYELMENCQFVASVTGTMIYEAVSGGKPAVMFGEMWHSRLPGVFKYSENLNVNEIMKYKINHAEVERLTRDFFSCCPKGYVWTQGEDFDQDRNDKVLLDVILSYLKNVFPNSFL